MSDIHIALVKRLQLPVPGFLVDLGAAAWEFDTPTSTLPGCSSGHGSGLIPMLCGYIPVVD
ncbi:hypothetical protein V8E36_005638 [Tilletia maclaganii]